MEHHPGNHPELIAEGTRCLAAQDGVWLPGTIHRANEDGTYTVEFDTKYFSFMPYWYGIPPDQISVDDEQRWMHAFAELSGRLAGMSLPLFKNALAELDYEVDDTQADAFWVKQCQALFGLEPGKSRDTVLNRSQAYQLILRAGCSARQFEIAIDPRISYFKLYWNQTRMGGRQPGDLHRPVVLDDAFTALGVSNPDEDVYVKARLEAFEKANGLAVPPSLRSLLCCSGIAQTVKASHPNAPELLLPGDRDFEIQQPPPLRTAHAQFALTLMLPHQGDHAWMAVFNNGDADARMYVTWGDDQWRLTAPTTSFFFWDLAQTGLIWHQNVQHQGERAIRKTDIGVAPCR